MQQYLDNIEDCTLGIFRKVISKHDYKLLLVSGDYDEKEAKEAWLMLFDEYSDSIKSGSVNYQFEVQKQIETKKNDYMIIQNCLHFVALYNEINIIGNMVKDITGVDQGFKGLNIDDVILLLNKYNFKFDKKKGIAKEVDRVNKQSKNILSKIESEIKKLESKNNDNPNKFSDIIISVFKHVGHLPDSVTMDIFVAGLNSLISYNEQLKQQHG